MLPLEISQFVVYAAACLLVLFRSAAQRAAAHSVTLHLSSKPKPHTGTTSLSRTGAGLIICAALFRPSRYEDIGRVTSACCPLVPPLQFAVCAECHPPAEGVASTSAEEPASFHVASSINPVHKRKPNATLKYELTHQPVLYCS